MLQKILDQLALVAIIAYIYLAAICRRHIRVLTAISQIGFDTRSIPQLGTIHHKASRLRSGRVIASGA